VIRAVRDYFQPDIGEILIDTDAIHEQTLAFMSNVMPDNVGRVKRLPRRRFRSSRVPDRASDRDRVLAPGVAPRGGAVVIDHTEALVSIDRQLGARHEGPRHRGRRVQHERLRPPTRSPGSFGCATWEA